MGPSHDQIHVGLELLLARVHLVSYVVPGGAVGSGGAWTFVGASFGFLTHQAVNNRHTLLKATTGTATWPPRIKIKPAIFYPVRVETQLFLESWSTNRSGFGCSEKRHSVRVGDGVSGLGFGDLSSCCGRGDGPHHHELLFTSCLSTLSLF